MALRGFYVQWANIDRLSSGLVSDARVAEHDDAENNQYAGNDGLGSRGTSSFLASIRQTNGFLHRSSSLNDVDQHHDNGKHQQEVNEPSHRVTAHQPQQPQHYQYYSNRPQHKILLSLVHGFTALAASMVICFVTLFTLSSFAAFFGLSFQTYYVVGRSLSVGCNPTRSYWMYSRQTDPAAGRV